MDDQALLEAIGRMMEAQKKEMSDLMDAKLAVQKEEMSGMMDAKLAAQKEEMSDLMDAKLAAQKEEMSGMMEAQKQELSDLMDIKLAAQKKEILAEATHRMKALLDLEVKPQFNLLAEEIQLLEEKVGSLTPVESVYADIYSMKAAIRTISKELKALKQAQ